MKISYNWLRNYVKFDLDPEQLSELLTGCGLEVEGMVQIESVKGGLKGVVVGKVLECVKHPGADKLSLTKVNIGQGEPLPIVCGAPNVAEGQKVLVATVGTTLYSGDKEFKISKTKIRGEVSEGMICAEDELGLGDSHDGIMVLPEKYETGKQASDYFLVYQDTVYEIGLTPNRTDAMSHVGVARDIVAVLNTENPGKYQLEMPSIDDFSVDEETGNISLKVENSDLCPRFSGVSISGIWVKSSPAWLKNYLEAIGVRPINNIVDITNFVLMELGQPLHAYDAGKIKGDTVVVRTARPGEKFITLDEVERELSPEDLMICDENDGMCIAGVFGGLNSGVTESTTEMFLESAHFNPVSVRKTSKFHTLQTDASFRFERGSDPEITALAMKRAAVLIRDIAGGVISSPVLDEYPEPVKTHEIFLGYSNTKRLIGIEIEKPVIVSILADLGIDIIEERSDGLLLSVPSFKWDVIREADVIEEIIRIYGFDKIPLPSSVKSSLSFLNRPDKDQIRNVVSELLSANGFYEIMNNSLTAMKNSDLKAFPSVDPPVRLYNPLSSDLNTLRTSLLPGALEVVAFNQNRKIHDLKVYEFGRVYAGKSDDVSKEVIQRFSEVERIGLTITGKTRPENWKSEPVASDFFDLKGFVFNLFTRLGIGSDNLVVKDDESTVFDKNIAVYISDDLIAVLGLVSDKLLEYYDLKQQVLYAEIDFNMLEAQLEENVIQYIDIPRYPEVRRDLALLVKREVTFAQIHQVALKYEKELLKEVSLFDVYEGEKIDAGTKSYAVSFILQDKSKTLTDKVIDKTMNKLIKAFEREIGASIRG